MRALKIMHILSDLEVGGAQKVVVNIVSNLDRSRFQPLVCTLRSGGALIAKLNEHNIRHKLVYFSSRFSFLGLWRLRNMLSDLDIDIVHTHLRRANISGRLAAVWAGVPVIIAHSHDLLTDKKFSHCLAARYLMKYTDCHFTISKAVRQSQVEHLKTAADKLTVLYNFINEHEYKTDTTKYLAKADLGVPVDNPCIGIVGRLHPLKGHHLFLEAAFMLNQKHPEIHFAIIGEGRLKAELLTTVRQLGMIHKVSFVGVSNDMARVYKALDALALCSSSEGLGMVLLEAQAARLPVVARSVGGVPEVLAGGGGIMVDNDKATPEALCKAFIEVLKPGVAKMLKSQMSGNLARFSAIKQITTLEDIYENLWEAKQKQPEG